MSADTIRARLLSSLPAGEWADVEFIENGDGMMALRYGAILARARWLRHGGQQPAFFKFIAAADDGAGSQTELVTGEGRLRRLYDRLTAMQSLGTAIPLVGLLEIRRLEDPEGLLIAMERVTVLHDVIAGEHQGGHIRLARRILQELSPPQGARFCHFDICPKNIGIRSDGSPVFIDPEGLFLVNQEGAQVTVPAWKRFRVPHDLVVEVDGHLSPGPLPPEIALKKHYIELALVAAECCIGPLSFRGANLNFDRSALATWVASDVARRHPQLARFWYQEFERLFDGRGVRDPRDIANDITDPELTLSPASSTSEQSSAFETPQVPTPDLNTPGSEFDTAWREILPNARALRAGKLDPHEIETYRGQLEDIVARYSNQPVAWKELLLVAVSYQKNRADAARFIKTACQAVDNDPDLRLLERIIDMWGVENHNAR